MTFQLDHGDRGAALLSKVKDQGASAPHADRDRSEPPPLKTDPRVVKLLGLSRWERAGMLAYIAANHPEVFDETYNALGLTPS